MSQPTPEPASSAPGDPPSPAALSTSVRGQPGRRLRIGGAILAFAGAMGIGIWGGWQLRARVEEPPAAITIQAKVDRPVLVLNDESRTPGAMPSVVGLTLDQARQALMDAGVANISEVPAPYAGPGGQVVAQDPAGGSTSGGSATLTYSQPTAVPEMVGARVADARGVLSGLGVRIEVVTRYVAGQPEGVVLSSTPGPGEALPTEMSLEVSEAASSVFLADLRANTSDCSIDDVTLNAVDHPGSIVCSPAYDEPEVVEYVLNRAVELFEATIGIDDRSEVGVPTRFRVLVDGQPAFESTVSYGTTQDISVPVSGALRVTLEAWRADANESCCDTDAGWGSARLSGGLDAVTRLFEESNS